MRIKRTSALVIIVSSLVIISVLALTIFGFYAYLEWKEKDMQKNYRIALYDLNAIVFADYVSLKLRATIDYGSVFTAKPIIEGTVKNMSNKKIFSLRVRIAFYDRDRRVVYADTFYPVGLDLESLINLGGVTENFLREGDSISFTRHLKNCPRKVVSYLGSQSRLTGHVRTETLKLDYKIEGIDIR
jgi:hypothetical protein